MSAPEQGGTAPDPVIPSPRHHLIFLIGPRGSGKSAVARLLAARLGWDWADADHELECRAGRCIRDIFAAEGENGFRERESAVLVDLCRLERHVIATGGGAVLRPENRARLRASGRVVWLTADAATLSHRIQTDETNCERRPSLTGTAAASSLQEIVQVLRAREPLYRECADFVVSTEGKAPEAVADELLKWWNAACGMRTGQ
jgi:shikimate kinase